MALKIGTLVDLLIYYYKLLHDYVHTVLNKSFQILRLLQICIHSTGIEVHVYI